jgi:hypothetical protein
MSDSIVSEKEQAELSDDELVALIAERTGHDLVDARELLTIIGGEIPEGTII